MLLGLTKQSLGIDNLSDACETRCSGVMLDGLSCTCHVHIILRIVSVTTVVAPLGSRDQLRDWPGKVPMQLARAAPGSLGC